MKIENMKIFLTVAQTLNINKAADELFLSHQNLSFIIKNMEKELGMTLFIRSKKGLQLTEDGADFLHIVQPIVTSYENFLNAKAEKNMIPILNVYTTPTLSAYISNLLDVSFGEACFLSMHKRNVNEMIDMLESNHQGVFLIPIYNGYPQIAADWKNKIVLLNDSTALIAHKDSVLINGMQNRADYSKLPLITSSYYLQSIENRMIINIDSIPACKKVMREKGFAYSATQWVFETFFAPDGDWQLLSKETSKIEYTVIMNIPSHLKRIATDKFIPVLQELFTLRMEEA